MTVIDTSAATAATATAYSNQRKIDRCQNGVLWVMHNLQLSGSFNFELLYSVDDGATWTSTPLIANEGGTGTTHTGNGSFFIDLDDYAHLVFKNKHNGYIYYRRGTPNVDRTAWTWSAATQMTFASASSTGHDYPDVVAHREGTGWVAHVVASFNSSGSNYHAKHQPITISSGGALVAGTTTVLNAAAGVLVSWPSIDFNHTGDGKTVAGGTPHLYAAWSAGAAGSGKGIRFKKATYAGGSWTWGTEREIDSTRYTAGGTTWINCLFDGSRVLIGGYTAVSSLDVVLYSRDVADTTTTTLVIEVSVAPADRPNYGNMSYDSDGKVYIIGLEVSGSPYDIICRTWDGSSLGTTVLVTDTSSTSPNVSAKRGYSNGKIEFIYTDGTSSPYNVTYGSIDLFTAATVKVWDGSAWVEGVVKRFDGTDWVEVEASKFKRFDGAEWVPA